MIIQKHIDYDNPPAWVLGMKAAMDSHVFQIQKLKKEIDKLEKQQLDFYTKDYNPVDDPATTPEIKTKNIAVIIGHHEFSQGAYSEHLESTEWAFYNNYFHSNGSVYTSSTNDFTNYNFVPFWRNNTGVKSAHDQIKNSIFTYEAVLELHFNAFRDTSVRGAEALVLEGDVKSSKIAKELLKQWADSSYRFKNRGTKYVSKGERGYYNLNGSNTLGIPYILFEPFFGTNKPDCIHIDIMQNPIKTMLKSFAVAVDSVVSVDTTK